MEVIEETSEVCTTHTLTLTPPTHAPSQVYAHVVFVDYGNVEMGTIQSSPYGKWAAEANDRFKQLTMSKYLMNQVKIFKAKS